jgi:hypothetical protein
MSRFQNLLNEYRRIHGDDFYKNPFNTAFDADRSLQYELTGSERAELKVKQSQSRCARFGGADADGIGQIRDKDLSIADFARLCM